MNTLARCVKGGLSSLAAAITLMAFLSGIYLLSQKVSYADKDKYTTIPAFAQLASNLPDIEGAMPHSEITAMLDWLPLGSGLLFVPEEKAGSKFYCTARFPTAIELASSDAHQPFSIQSQGDIIVNRKVIRYALIVPLSRSTTVQQIEHNSKCLHFIGVVK